MSSLLCLDSTRPIDDWERDELSGADSVPLVAEAVPNAIRSAGTACKQAVARHRIIVLTKCDARRAIGPVAAIETSSRTSWPKHFARPVAAGWC